MTRRLAQEPTPDVTISDAALQTALEYKPQVAIPADFAARVSTQAAELSPARRSRVPQHARLTALVVAFVVAVSLFALAPRATASFGDLVFDLELVLLLQVGLLAWWLTRRPTWGS